MKVLQIVDSLRVGGTERMAINIANALSDAKVDNHLVVSREGNALAEYLNVPEQLTYLNKKNRFDRRAFKKLSRLVKSYQPDVLHCHSSSAYWGVLLKWQNPTLKLIFHDHCGVSESLKTNDRRLLRYVSRWIDGVVAVNDKLADWAVNSMKLKAVQIIQLDNFPYLTRKESTKREKKTIVKMANFRPQKDHHTLVRAIDLLVQNSKFTRADIEVLLVGDDKIDPDYTTSVKELIASFHLEEVVKVTGPCKDVASLLAEVHLGILSSASEGLPVSLLEYGLAGLPVVCTRVGQCAKVLQEGKLGWLAEANDPVQMAKAIQQAFENKNNETKHKAADFNAHIQSQFGPLHFVEKYRSFTSSVG